MICPLPTGARSGSGSRSSGVNPTDWKFRTGTTAASMPFDEIVPGQDGAGIVDEVGNGVFDVKVGERVWVFLAQHDRPLGTAAEYTVVPADRVVGLGDASYDVGASLGVPAMTAHRALTIHEDGPSRLAPGALDDRTVLVTGGAGAVGHAADPARGLGRGHRGHHGQQRREGSPGHGAGAHHVVNYRTGDAAAEIKAIAPEGVDLVVDVALSENADVVAQVLKTRGAVSAYANTGGTKLKASVRPLMVLNARLQFILLYTVGDKALRAACRGRRGRRRRRRPRGRRGARTAARPVPSGGDRGGPRRGRERRCRQGPDRRRGPRLTRPEQPRVAGVSDDFGIA